MYRSTAILLCVIAVLLVLMGKTWLQQDRLNCVVSADALAGTYTWNPISGCRIEFDDGKWTRLQR